MKSFLLSAFLVVTMMTVFGQDATFIKEKWSEKPVLHAIDPKMKSGSAIIVLDKRRVEYVDEKSGELAVYRTLHRIVQVNDDHGIESFNKVYLGVSDNSEIADIRARTVLPGGKIIEIDKSNIKDQKEEDGSTYKIFALEGLEKGCQIEFYYTYKRNASYFGKEILQGRYPVLNAQVEIVSPERLSFETKDYNGVAVRTDSLIGGKQIIYISRQGLPGVEQEKYSYHTSNLQRVEYKLSYNKSRKTNDRLFT